MTGSAAGGAIRRGPVDPRLLRHARSSRGGVAALAVIGTGQAGATLLLAVALSRIVAGAAGPAITLLAAAFLCRAVFAAAEQVVAQRTAARATDELRQSVLAAVLRRGPAWAAHYGAGRLVAVLTTGLDALRPWFSGYLPALVLGVALPPLVITAMAVVDPGSALIALVTLPLIPVLGALIGWATQARARQRWEADARLAGHFLDVVRGLPALRVFGRAERQIEVVAAMTDRHRAATMRVLRVAFLSSTALDLVGTLSVGLIAVEAGLRVAGGSLGLGPALLVILLAPEAYRPLREMAARFHASADASAVIADVDEALGDSSGCSARRVGEHLPTAASGGAVGVVAHGVRVRYLGSDVDALGLAGLVVRGGEFVALRGPSGAGKTTLLRALAGLQPLDAGSVEVFGPEVVYLPQRPGLPHARSVAGVFGEPAPSGQEVVAALRVVGLASEVGPETPLGERGDGVSAGQRQRLALAALLRRAGREPRVLLLDEPTAHLDAESERLVIAELRAAARRGCAVLAVAHRPALLATADTVVDITAPVESGPAGPGETADPLETFRADLRRASREALSRRWPRRSAAAAPTRTWPPPGAKAAPSRAWPRLEGKAVAPSRERRWTAGAAAPSRERRWTAGAVALGAASWLAGIVLTGAAAWLLVRAATLPPVLTLSVAVVLVRASAVARPLLRYLERLVAHDVAFDRLGARRARVFADLIPLVPGAWRHRRGDLLTRVVNDVDAEVDGLLRGWLPAASAAVAVGVAGIVTVLVAPGVWVPLGAGLLVAAVVAPALAAGQAARWEAATGRARSEFRDAVVETVDSLEDLARTGDSGGRAGAVRTPGRSFGEDRVGVPGKRSAVLGGLEARAARAAGIAAGVAHLGWGLAVVGAAMVLAGGHGPGPEWAAVVLLGIVALGEPVAGFPEAAVARQRAAGARDRIAAIAAEPASAPTEPAPNEPAPTEPAAPKPTATNPAATGPAMTGPAVAGPAVGSRRTEAGGGWGDVVVRGLVAGWDPEREPALDGLDLDLPAGARVAVLGPSGGGKSTLAAVLARLLAPRAGTVTVGGVDLRELPDALVRRRVALVGDDVDHVFASTVRENLRLARPDADDATLAAALARVGLGGWRLDTWLGTGGTTMSGGQRRRFATARALLADPALLILDEPTEGLDEVGAEALMADLLGAGAGRTVLVLTHRSEGLDLVDKTGVLRGGRIFSLTNTAT